MFRNFLLVILFALVSLGSQPVTADPFEHGWTLDEKDSSVSFVSVKKGAIAEQSHFASIAGQITPDGLAQIKVALDSVDTKVDLRNVRMRFLFFETFTFPEATVTAVLDPAVLSDLSASRRIVIPLPVTLALHGIKADLSPNVAITLLSNDRVNISTIDPIILKLEDFNLMEGREKLQEAANVTIAPIGLVTLDLNFDRLLPGTPVAVATPRPSSTGASAALETEGNFSREACLGRFEILSRSRSVNFAPGTSRLDSKSTSFLDSLFDIISRCPDMVVEVGGHTDDLGSDASNQRLSQKRANAVVTYLTQKGLGTERLQPVGYGETSPLVPNSNRKNRAKNRRIAFKVLN